MLKIFFSALYIYAIAGVIYNMCSGDLQWLFKPNSKKMYIKVIVDTLARMVVAIVLWPILAYTNYLERKAKVHG